MKRLLLILAMMCTMSVMMNAQVSEVGVGIGTSNFLGDLGKKSPKMNNYFGDLDGSLFRPAGQVFYRHTFSRRFALKASLSLGSIAGDDRLANTSQHRDDGWYRNYRNLHFKSILLEFSLVTEFHILKYVPGSIKKYRWTPFVFGGVGLFYFNPKAQYNGEWVALQPLGTEGQGLEQYPDRKKYSRIQPSIPLGIGFKFNVTPAWAISLEAGHRITLTDYMDDVSTTYVGYDDFASNYDQSKARMVYELSRRSPEKDPEGVYGTITKEGEYRGNPEGNDAYLFTMVTVSYTFGSHSKREHDPFAKKLNGKYRRIFR